MGDNCFALLRDYKTFNNRAKFIFLLTFFFTLTILFAQTIQADVISLNAGGSQNLAITPDKFIEGFFSGDVVAAVAVCGNSIVETGETCDDGGVVSGDGCSSTCQTEVVTPPGGGGGGIIEANLLIDPTEFNIKMAISTSREEIIKVTNLGTDTVTVTVSQQSLDRNIILGNTSLTIVPGETVNLDVIFVALTQTGIFTGKIVIGNEEVLITLNIRTKLILFDSNIVVLNENFQVPQGEKLKTLVTLVPLGDPERLDVTLNFVIKDYNNKIYLTKSETLLVEKQMELNRNFDTGFLPLGDYIIGLELIYPNGVAPSSAHFQVTSPVGIFGKIVLYLISLILLLAIFILIILIWRRRKKKEEEAQGVVGATTPV